MNEMLGTKHMILLAVSLICVIGGAVGARKLKLSQACKVLFYIGIVAEIIKLFYYTAANEDKLGGVLPKSDLPFHLCSIQLVFICIANFTKKENIKRFLFSFMMPSCLIGGLAALLIPTDSSLNGSWIITLEYFAYHAAIMVFSLKLMTSGELKFRISDYLNCLKMLLIMMFFAFYINSILYDGTGSDPNFMYVSSPPQSGLPYLTEEYGWNVYIVHYMGLVLSAVTLFYIKPIVLGIKEFFTKKKKASV